MADVPNVDESVVNDVTQGGIMTEVRTDVNVNAVSYTHLRAHETG